MKKLPYDVQSLICASNQIKNHNKAVEELVYNALDARATSIAIRINIQENTIQVIDNGCGVSSEDYYSIGHKYMTSKFSDLSTLKSAPNYYGYRGQALANIINVSKCVKLTSRHENSVETWMRVFEYGKEKLIDKCTLRPSKGTTVEIIGFLYNLTIQKKTKDILGDLQNIKTFLEHLSLIHCNISLSLRDDSKNEIVFKMHKNRDIYQTLSVLYHKDKTDLQELQVAKNEYKVTAYLGKSDGTGKNMLFLNGKIIWNTSKLHKIVNNNLSKHFECKPRGIQRSKVKNINTEEENNWIQKKIPDYFIFIKCPYMDYDLSNKSKQSVIEFRDWDQIVKLLDKLIKLYYGDINLRREYKVDTNQTNNKDECSDTRNQVKKIMEKILGSKKPGISHMHNAIKGKQVKRKKQKLFLQPIVVESNHKEIGNDNSSNNMLYKNNYKQFYKTKESHSNKKCITNNYSNLVLKSPLGTNVDKRYNLELKKVSKNRESNIPLKESRGKKIVKQRKSNINIDVILRKFEKNTDSIKKKSEELEQKTKCLLEKMHKKACQMFANENIVTKDKKLKRHINISVRKQIDEILIQNNVSNRPKSKRVNKYKACKILKKKLVQSNYDLLHTILNSQLENKIQIKNVPDESNSMAAIMSSPKVASIDDVNKSLNMEPQNIFIEPMITFKSHKYNRHQSYNIENNSFHSHKNFQNENQHTFHDKPRTFITKQSKDNFIIPNDAIKNHNFKKKNQRPGFAKKIQSHIKNLFKKTSTLFNLKKQIIGNTCESSYTIEFFESNGNRLTNNKDIVTTDAARNTRMSIEKILPDSDNTSAGNDCFINTDTYIIPNVDNNGYTINNEENLTFCGTYTIEQTNEMIDNTNEHNPDNRISGDCQKNKNFIFVSKSQEHDQNEHNMYPIDVCEIILHSDEMLDREFELSFIDKEMNLPKEHNYSTNSQRNYDDSLYGCIYSKENNVTENQNGLGNISKVSNHFRTNINVTNKVNKITKTINSSPILISRQNIYNEKKSIQQTNISKTVSDSNIEDFNFMNRLCFLPKGMSPIFQNCQTKNACEYNLSSDYYEKKMYNNFVDDVRNNAEIFDSNIQDTKEMATKAIHKVNVKITKDNSELKFDGQSLKDVKVLGQIDEKFIATIMKKGSNVTPTDFLVLFDQHAVHERILLENNLADYFNENQWKPVTIDAVSLILSGDDVLYLHNFKDKFEQLGLLWTITSAYEVSVRAIPEAILGKTPRQVDKVIKAVKTLIAEEINILKIQGGCISLYPKSIMDLVFSEACRYAIKFGDKLSRSECVELLKTLSSCKTPFQCAHGRPVMAVIMETKLNRIDYKINLDKIMEWKRKCK